MPHDSVARLRHMLDAACEATTLLGDRTCDQLRADRRTTLALVKCVEIIGEAACHIDDQWLARIDLPWPMIRNMRHRLVHAYFDINIEILHQTIADDLPPLIAVLEAAFGEH